MAKKRPSNQVDESPVVVSTSDTSAAPAGDLTDSLRDHPGWDRSPDPAPAASEHQFLTVTLPSMPIPKGHYVPTRLDARLTVRQAQALKMLTLAFDSAGARLPPTPGRLEGRRVVTPGTAVQQLLDMVADSAGLPEIGMG